MKKTKFPVSYISLLFVVPIFFGSCERADDSLDMQKRIAQLELENRQQSTQLKQKDPERTRMTDELKEAREKLQSALDELKFQSTDPPEEVVAVSEELEFDDSSPVLNAVEVVSPAFLDQALESKDFQVFFVELSRFGEWFQTDEYGYVWQPKEVETDSEWRPYTRGQWLYSDQGWTWASDEPFGWAVYHYGRWALLQERGWVWIPGEDWAPAWVSWRSNDDYLGWAPLPPETLYEENYDYDSGVDSYYDTSPSWYSFVPMEHFYEPVVNYCVPQATVISIFIYTNNVTRIHTRNRRVYCNGPDYEWVGRRCGKKVKHYKLDLKQGHHYAGGRERHHVQGDHLRIFAPQVKSAWNPAVRPVRVNKNLGSVKVERDGKKMNPDAMKRFQVASVQRQETARKAMSSKEGREAMLKHRRAEELVAGKLRDRVRDEAVKVQEKTVATSAAQIQAVKTKGSQIQSLNLGKKEGAVKGATSKPEVKGDKRNGSVDKKRFLQTVTKTKKDKLAPATQQHSASSQKEDAAKQLAELAKERSLKLESTSRDALRRAEMESRKRDSEMASRKRAEQESSKRVAEAKARAGAERQKAEMESRKRASEMVSRKRAEQESSKRVAEAKVRADAGRQKAELDSRKRATEMASRKRAEQESRKRASEAKVRADAGRQKAELDSRKRATEMASRKRAEQESRKRASEAKVRADAQRQKVESDARKRASEMASRKRAEQENGKRVAEARARADAQRQKVESDSRKRASEMALRKRAEQENGKRVAEARARADAQRQKAERDSRKRVSEMASRKRAVQESGKRASEAKARAEAQRRAQERAAAAARRSAEEAKRKQGKKQKKRK